ncbi:glycoside hydrolase family 125 protein [Metabacillus sp. KUDC1714]|uniref:Glycoside hydrolase family 125 protein n=1 Tax=Metabacillus elymi TaxID=2745198 RepID=A0ABX6S8N4_9BACI|nr:glycoside hydrolase family 125 protein [Metabacillus sp. KUDC1714]
MQLMTNYVPKSLMKIIEDVETFFSGNDKVHQLFKNCFMNTYQTTLTEKQDDTTFVVTGDIPAM